MARTGFEQFPDVAEHVISLLTNGHSITTARLARQTGLTPLNAARVLGNLVEARRITCAGGRYSIRAAR